MSITRPRSCFSARIPKPSGPSRSSSAVPRGTPTQHTRHHAHRRARHRPAQACFVVIAGWWQMTHGAMSCAVIHPPVIELGGHPFPRTSSCASVSARRRRPGPLRFPRRRQISGEWTPGRGSAKPIACDATAGSDLDAAAGSRTLDRRGRRHCAAQIACPVSHANQPRQGRGAGTRRPGPPPRPEAGRKCRPAARAACRLDPGGEGVPARPGGAGPPARKHARQDGPAGAETVRRCPERRPIGHAAGTPAPKRVTERV